MNTQDRFSAILDTLQIYADVYDKLVSSGFEVDKERRPTTQKLEELISAIVEQLEKGQVA